LPAKTEGQKSTETQSVIAFAVFSPGLTNSQSWGYIWIISMPKTIVVIMHKQLRVDLRRC
jgi:hypothetical protein